MSKVKKPKKTKHPQQPRPFAGIRDVVFAAFAKIGSPIDKTDLLKIKKQTAGVRVEVIKTISFLTHRQMLKLLGSIRFKSVKLTRFQIGASQLRGRPCLRFIFFVQGVRASAVMANADVLDTDIRRASSFLNELLARSGTPHYPAAIPPQYAHTDYKSKGGRLCTVSPQDFLASVKRLDIDESSRDNIEDLKEHIRSGREIDPPVVHVKGRKIVRHDGRHRAVAARELGIRQMPVIVLDDNGDPAPEFKQLEKQVGAAMMTAERLNSFFELVSEMNSNHGFRVIGGMTPATKVAIEAVRTALKQEKIDARVLASKGARNSFQVIPSTPHGSFTDHEMFFIAKTAKDNGCTYVQAMPIVVREAVGGKGFTFYTGYKPRPHSPPKQNRDINEKFHAERWDRYKSNGGTVEAASLSSFDEKKLAEEYYESDFTFRLANRDGLTVMRRVRAYTRDHAVAKLKAAKQWPRGYGISSASGKAQRRTK